jgi:hypothetical protein
MTLKTYNTKFHKEEREGVVGETVGFPTKVSLPFVSPAPQTHIFDKNL